MDRIKQYRKLNNLKVKEFIPETPINSTHPLKIIFTLNETILYYNPLSKLYSKKNIVGGGPKSIILIDID